MIFATAVAAKRIQVDLHLISSGRKQLLSNTQFTSICCRVSTPCVRFSTATLNKRQWMSPPANQQHSHTEQSKIQLHHCSQDEDPKHPKACEALHSNNERPRKRPPSVSSKNQPSDLKHDDKNLRRESTNNLYAQPLKQPKSPNLKLRNSSKKHPQPTHWISHAGKGNI